MNKFNLSLGEIMKWLGHLATIITLYEFLNKHWNKNKKTILLVLNKLKVFAFKTVKEIIYINKKVIIIFLKNYSKPIKKLSFFSYRVFCCFLLSIIVFMLNPISYGDGEIELKTTASSDILDSIIEGREKLFSQNLNGTLAWLLANSYQMYGYNYLKRNR